MKKCIICNEDKELNSFYKHSQMKDGYLNKCKSCCKSQARNNHKEKSKDPDWVEKERARGREKYERLNYKKSQKKWDESKPWKQTSTYKNLSRDLKIPKGIAAHHWCYNDDKLKDVVLMSFSDHRQLHLLLDLDIEKRIFKVKATGEYLDSRTKHLDFIKSSGFSFIEYDKRAF